MDRAELIALASGMVAALLVQMGSAAVGALPGLSGGGAMAFTMVYVGMLYQRKHRARSGRES